MTEAALPAELRALEAGDPEAIGPFRVVGRLGAGGMGAVFGALDSAGTCVAVKVIHAHFADQEEYLARFTREVELVRGVDAECAPAFLGADPAARPPWLATEFVPGRTLSAHVREFGPLTGPELVLFAAGTAEAIAALHARGVIHQDIKPGNVILSPNGPKVLDFGIARSVHDTGREEVIAGTPGYLAPERLDGARSTPAADVFAWAAMVVYAATGHHPYPGDTTDAVLTRIRTGAQDLSGVPDELLPLIRRGLERTPESRPSAGDAYSEVLDTLFPEVAQSTAAEAEPRPEPTLPYVPPPGAPAPAAPMEQGGAVPVDPQRARLRQALRSAWVRFDSAGHDPRAWGALAGAHLGAAGAVGLVAANTGIGAAAAPVATGGTILGVKTSVAVATATAVVAAGAVGGGIAVTAVNNEDASDPTADTQATAQAEAGENEEEDDGPPFEAQEVEFRGVTFHIPEEWDVYPQESLFAPAMEAGGETEEWLVLSTDPNSDCDENTDWQPYNSADMCDHIKVLGPAAIAVGGPTTIPYTPNDVYAPVMEPQPCPPGITGDEVPENYAPDSTPLDEGTVQAEGTEITFRQHSNTCMTGPVDQVFYPQNAYLFDTEEVLLVDDWANEDLAEFLEYAEA
ncbi:serine/threonine protein kinase [Spiractinospora alimapuensis]|uniref:serine/threonine protein kinase n=1 Tax=Spiractinospora alimapuensis TaxID=2820884 RepID=UPI001F1A2D4E|nr:serine/threonine-protein kinase [Spiractinospora alimapuensis]QVQ51509.1 serine/threonine protein kinase [Spiractinospora alimapuensis]